MKTIASLASFVALATVVSADRTFTVSNHCSYTIWPGLFTTPGKPAPSQATGWELLSGDSTTFTMPETWGGRIWPRTECDFSTNPGPTSCATGGCNGGLVCDPNNGGTGQPSTLAEFTLDSASTDTYDVSLVDAFNVPLDITPSVSSCPSPTCSVNLNTNCPTALQEKDASGTVVACLSDCKATNDPAACCTGDHSTPATCPTSGVPFYSYFKDACPDAYAYAYDDLTSTFHCPESDGADYTITFCP
ncbi:Osmotin, thaumatin-like protein [Peniophora sp. CONT]|nr:Osmotin, thaumatin-like protein [Peniophora sp. CONT]